MIKGKILQDIEEMKKKGKGVIYPRIYSGNGTIGNEEFTVASGLDCSVFVTIKGKTVKYDARDIVNDALKEIEDDETRNKEKHLRE